MIYFVFIAIEEVLMVLYNIKKVFLFFSFFFVIFLTFFEIQKKI